MADPDDRWKRRGETVRDMSQALAIPTMWVGGPIGVGAVGWLIGNWLGAPTPGAFIGVILGLVIAIRETKRITKRLSGPRKP